MAAKKTDDIKTYRRGEIKPDKCDFILNVETCTEIIKSKKVPNAYYEIDNHCSYGKHRKKYAQADLIIIAQYPFIRYFPTEKTVVVPLAAQPTVHRPFPNIREKYDVGFLGNDSYPMRSRLLDEIGLKYKLLRTTAIAGLPYSRALSACKVLFNCSLDNDVNMRFFESMAIGKPLVTDYLPEQDLFAKEGTHYLGYITAGEAIEKIDYLLKKPDLRKSIGYLAMLHTRKYHTYEIRLRQIIQHMQQIKDKKQL
jgi:glycosyltransferase involved in cell wall biosynthesis